MIEKPLFADVSHALHVSYLVLSLPPRQKAPFRNMLIQLLEAIDEPTAAQEKWLADLRGPGGGGYEEDRLSMDEVRAQYAMITDAAKTRLPSPEYAAVLRRCVAWNRLGPLPFLQAARPAAVMRIHRRRITPEVVHCPHRRI